MSHLGLIEPLDDAVAPKEQIAVRLGPSPCGRQAGFLSQFLEKTA
jgi:hypothetical protein